MTKEEKRGQEQALLSEMIALYCKGRHKTPRLCASCRELMEYAHERTAKCPNMETKTFCSVCKTPCYKPDMRQRIREVMVYSGPRMLFRHPVIALRHMRFGANKKV